MSGIVPMISNLVALKVVSDVALKVAKVPTGKKSRRIRAY